MRIWKLTPTNLEDPIWRNWSPEPIIVRAETEREARRLATDITIKTFAPVSPMLMPVNPWFGRPKIGDPSPTTSEDITEETNEYSLDGPAEVLRHGKSF